MSNKTEILGVPVNIITQNEAVDEIISLFKSQTLSKVYTPNPEMIMLAQEDQDFLQVLKSADIILPDGIGLLIASKIKGLGLKERVTGIDTMNRLLEHCHSEHRSIFILGGKPGISELASENILKQFPGIKECGFHHGYFQKEDEINIINKINDAKTDILFVCLGAPKQEKWIYEYERLLKCKVAMGVGGSVDIYAGTAKRAPIVYQKLGLEWLYRLIKEPWRYKRMLSLPKFLFKILK